jgi:Protein of Unknown function (DUF2604)
MARQDPHLDLIIVVSGAPQAVRINAQERLEHAVREALRLSGNQGQPPEEWELRTEDGQLLNPQERADATGVLDGQTLFLSPRAGAGG